MYVTQIMLRVAYLVLMLRVVLLSSRFYWGSGTKSSIIGTNSGIPGPIIVNKLDSTFQASKDVPDEETPILKKEYVPYFLNPFHLSNAAFMMSYFNVGLAMNFLATPVSYYLITTLGISATQYSAYIALIGIPWSLKFLFGMISDGIPILKYRRKSWFTVGWTGFIAINLYLAFTGAPSVNIVISLMLLMTCTYLLADVCTDTIAVERSRYETDMLRGSLQTSAYTIRSFGTIIGALLGTLFYNTRTWGWGLTISQCFFLSALIPMVTIIPVVIPLEELVTSNRVPTVSQQFQEIWKLLQKKAVYRTVGYIFFYGVFQIPNGSWSTFLLKGLEFTDFQYGMLNVAGCVLAWVGMNTYRAYFFETSWRYIYIYTTILGTGFSLLQIVLILQLNQNIGIPNFYFALGDTAATAVISAIQFMPSCIMFAMLCPEGSEGVSYAFLTTVTNLAGSVSADLGSAFTIIWDVSNETIAGGDYSGVLKLAILTSLLQLVPLLFVWILPESKADQMALRESGITSCLYGGILLTIITLSLLGSVVGSAFLLL